MLLFYDYDILVIESLKAIIMFLLGSTTTTLVTLLCSCDDVICI